MTRFLRAVRELAASLICLAALLFLFPALILIIVGKYVAPARLPAKNYLWSAPEESQ